MPVYKLKKLLEEITENKIWERGEKISEYGNFTGKDIFSEKKDGKNKFFLTGVYLEKETVYTPSLSWEKDKKEIKISSYSCDCEYYSINKKPCEHITGVLLDFLLEKERKEKLEHMENEKIKLLFSRKNIFLEKKEKNKKRIMFSIKTDTKDLNEGKIIFFNFSVYDKAENRYEEKDIEEILKNNSKESFDKISQDFITFISCLKKESRETNFGKNEIIIPEFAVEKGVSFLEELGKNFDSKLKFPLEIIISQDFYKYTIEFKNFAKVKVAEEEYLIYENNDKVNIYKVGRKKAEKVKFIKSLELKNEKMEIFKNVLSLSEIVNSIYDFGDIVFDESIKSKIILNPDISICLFVSDFFNKGITITPQFIYNGHTAEENENYVILENQAKEKQLLEKLKETLEFYGFEKKGNIFFLPNEEDVVYEFMANYLRFMTSQYQIRVSKGIKDREYGKIIPNVSVIVGEKINVNFSFEGKNEINKRKVKDILKEAAAGKKYYHMENGGILCINTPEIIELEGILSSLNAEKDEIDSGILIRDKSFFPFIKNRIANLKEQTFFNIIDKRGYVKKYSCLRESGFLKQYQKKSAYELLLLRQFKMGAILFDDIGLGKCAEIAAALKTAPLKKHGIIIAPSYKMKYWERELSLYLKKNSVKVIFGKNEDRIKKFEKVKEDEIMIMSYKDFVKDWLRFEYINFEMMIFDNPLFISKEDSREKLLNVLKKIKSDSTFCLTNGYDEKNYRDIFYMFELIKPGYLGTKKMFISKYIEEKEDTDRRREFLSALTKPYLLGKTKEKVLDELPEKIAVNLFLIMADYTEERKLYMRYIEKINKMVLFYKNLEKSNMKIFTLLERMRKVCCNAEKIKAVFGIFKECSRENRKVFVATKYLDIAETIYKKCCREYEECYFVFSDMSEEKKEKIYSKMYSREYKNKSVFVVAYDISYEELQEVEYDVIIYFDPHWEKIYYKDEKKLYRKKPVEINLLTERTFEEKILNWKSLCENKIIKNYLVPKNEDTRRKPKFTKEDFMELLYI